MSALTCSNKPRTCLIRHLDMMLLLSQIHVLSPCHNVANRALEPCRPSALPKLALPTSKPRSAILPTRILFLAFVHGYSLIPNCPCCQRAATNCLRSIHRTVQHAGYCYHRVCCRNWTSAQFIGQFSQQHPRPAHANHRTKTIVLHTATTQPCRSQTSTQCSCLGYA